MLSFDEINEAIDEIVSEIPQPILNMLNCGIILRPEIKMHPKSRNDDLYVTGEYHNDPYGLGRYITVYYGSYVKAYGHLRDEAVKEKLKQTIYHELTHHLESLAGDKSLDIKDALQINKYLSGE